ncbi:class I SAM-dependent methyltransferase [Bacillus pacificus]
MAFTESDVYNNEAFFEQYMKRRYRENSPNESLEKPAFFQLISNVKGKRILDLGCGDAKFGEELLEKGCHSYTGIEGSELMYEKAKKTTRKQKWRRSFFKPQRLHIPSFYF